MRAHRRADALAPAVLAGRHLRERLRALRRRARGHRRAGRPPHDLLRWLSRAPRFAHRAVCWSPRLCSALVADAIELEPLIVVRTRISGAVYAYPLADRSLVCR